MPQPGHRYVKLHLTGDAALSFKVVALLRVPLEVPERPGVPRCPTSPSAALVIRLRVYTR